MAIDNLTKLEALALLDAAGKLQDHVAEFYSSAGRTDYYYFEGDSELQEFIAAYRSGLEKLRYMAYPDQTGRDAS